MAASRVAQPADDAGRRIASAWRELRRGAASAALRAHLVGDAPAFRHGPIEQAQLDALEVLAGTTTGWRMSEFADAMHVDPSTATRTVDRLERAGLATRSTDPDDRRVVVARPTELGRRLIRDVIMRRASGMERLLASFEPDEREQFADLLERFVAAVDRLVDELAHDAPHAGR